MAVLLSHPPMSRGLKIEEFVQSDHRRCYQIIRRTSTGAHPDRNRDIRQHRETRFLQQCRRTTAWHIRENSQFRSSAGTTNLPEGCQNGLSRRGTALVTSIERRAHTRRAFCGSERVRWRVRSCQLQCGTATPLGGKGFGSSSDLARSFGYGGDRKGSSSNSNGAGVPV